VADAQDSVPSLHLVQDGPQSAAVLHGGALLLSQQEMQRASTQRPEKKHQVKPDGQEVAPVVHIDVSGLHLPTKLHVLSSAVSMQPLSSGGQSRQGSPHFLPAQGLYGDDGHSGKTTWHCPFVQRLEGQLGWPLGHSLQAMRMSGHSLSALH
jgi:hypothetical protein